MVVRTPVAKGGGTCIMIRTPDQRVRVFVSSTLKELAAERQAVTAAITQLRLTPVLFELGARPYPPRDLYRAYLEQSDIFVGIYAESYGWIGPGMEVSGLEDEYQLSAGKPRLIYTKKTSRPEPRLTSFLTVIQAEGVVSYRPFADADELVFHGIAPGPVVHSLGTFKRKRRGDALRDRRRIHIRHVPAAEPPLPLRGACQKHQPCRRHDPCPPHVRSHR